MELRHLRAFVVVAEELHVGRAADRLHVTQPTLSRQIAALEGAVGAPLFSRARRRLALTPAGHVLLDGARELLVRADEVARDVQRAHRGETGTVRVGFVQSATFETLPSIVRAFRAAFPDVVLDVRPMTTLDQVRALRHGRLDVGLLRPRGPEPGVVSRVVSRDPLVAALPSEHPLAAHDRLRLADMADEAFVFYSRPSGPDVHDTIVGYCRDAGFSPRIVQEAWDVQTLTALVAANLGVSLLIAPTPSVHGGAVTFRPLADDLPPWEMVLAWPTTEVTPAVERFLEVAQQVTLGPADASPGR